MNHTINERVAIYRRLANLTQARTAEIMGMKSSTYSQMERRGNISAERIVKLAEIFNVKPSTLLYGEPVLPEIPPEPPEPEPPFKQPDPPVPPIPEPPPIILTNKEISIINVLRNLHKKDLDEVVAFIETKRKKK